MNEDYEELGELAKQMVIETMQEGERNGKMGWKEISTGEHFKHADAHLFSFIKGHTNEDHIAHFVTRGVMMRWKENQLSKQKLMADMMNAGMEARKDAEREKHMDVRHE